MTQGNFDLLKTVREHVRKQTYRVKFHAEKRQTERLISLKDTLHVLKTGHHEEEKSGFDVKRQAWKYAIRGKTCDSIELRVVVAFSQNEMFIITVMRIKARAK